MVKDAELAMYQAKRFGGDRIEPFRPGLPHGRHRPAAARIRPAPRHRAQGDQRSSTSRSCGWRTAAIAGFEALLRWDHPRRGAIPPADFIPVAESCGLIVQLGLFAMRARGAEPRRLAEADRRSRRCSVSVNVSSRQLLRRDLVNDVRSVHRARRAQAALA